MTRDLTHNELARVSALEALKILDTEPEAAFDELTSLAARIFNVPIALVSLVDTDRQWFKSRVGLSVCETDRDISFCTHAIQTDKLLVVTDAWKDPRFSQSPLVLGEPHIRFYAGYPLRLKSGHAVGSFCVIDRKPREFSVVDCQNLEALGRQVVAQLELRSALTGLALTSERQEITQVALQASGIGLWRMIEATSFVLLDQVSSRLFGAPNSGKVPYLTLVKLISEQDRAYFEEAVSTAIARQSAFDVTLRVLEGNDRRSLRLRGHFRVGVNGEASELDGFVWDVTAEEALRMERQRLADELKIIFSSMREGLVVQDRGGAIVEFNSAATDILGLTADELMGRTSVDPHWRSVREDGSDFPGLEHPAMLALATGKPQTGVAMGIHGRGGARTWIQINSVPLFRVGEDSPYRVMTTFADITARKRLEADLLESNKAVQEASKAKSQFLANMSHEMRTPLNGIIGMSELLQGTQLTSEQSELNDAVSASGRSMLGIVNDILDLAKVEAGKFSLEPRPMEMCSVLRQLTKPFEFGAESKGLKFEMKLPGGHLAVLGDSLRLGQVITNLLGNGLKFTSSGSISVELKVLQELPDGYQLRFSVTDTGRGIPEEAAARLFNPYSQLSEGGSGAQPGTGLGLYISKRLVELMGGSIGFASNLGHGATFWFELNLPKADFVPINRSAVEEDSKVSVPLSERAKVLVAEDNSVNQRLIAKILEKAGYKFLIVSNGQEAISALEREAFNIVLMDCMMPVMDGYKATSLIRKSAASYSGIPIIALTANAISGERERCLALGMSDFLTKPVDRKELVALIGERVSRVPSKTA